MKKLLIALVAIAAIVAAAVFVLQRIQAPVTIREEFICGE